MYIMPRAYLGTGERGNGGTDFVATDFFRGKGFTKRLEMTQHMAGFVRVAQVSELAPGEMKWVVANRQRLLLANVGGTFYAISDQCGHERASLSQGRLDGQEVECPRHYAKFDVRTGKLISGPLSQDVPSYELRVERHIVYVQA